MLTFNFYKRLISPRSIADHQLANIVSYLNHMLRQNY